MAVSNTGVPSLREIITRPLPLSRNPVRRLVHRSVLALLRPILREARGIENLESHTGPFILALNHTLHLEAVAVPALLAWHRNGEFIRFMADWNFLMIPAVGTIMRMGEVIPVASKRARPAFITPLRRWLVRGSHGLDAAREALLAGRSIGIFPEMKAHGDPRSMRQGARGAALLSVSLGVPVLPAGIRYAGSGADGSLPWYSPFALEIGRPLSPPPGEIGPEAVHRHHESIMSSIALLARKQWQPQHQGTSDDAHNALALRHESVVA